MVCERARLSKSYFSAGEEREASRFVAAYELDCTGGPIAIEAEGGEAR